jgi:uncharacterized membrane protein YoaK (UPF0700 family)
MDRRAAFFLGAAIVSAVLVPVTEREARWVPVALAITYLLLAAASWADRRSRRLGHRAGPPR